ncbi:putative ribosome biogenesis protein ALB1 [Rosellinia necatrix]|uniref:Putative ribosome biogenesis protein ALB1 n=1 Tax=Rosellinia necatrix TaxID=77044 RepID=A0A1W2TXB1_ROSNE|nr:putative ribosome biogenesis protein ALB1 [Rosellinia necatrix]
MPSVKNPNGPSKNRLAARTATARKRTAKQLARRAQAERHQISGADARRGARAGLLPTSGPNRALSAKKARRLERKAGYALARKAEAAGEVVMKDASTVKRAKAKKQREGVAVTEEMAVDTDDIS